MPDSQKDSKWLEFYEITKNKPPSPLLVKAIKFVSEKDRALDLGAGALRDTRFLLQTNFQSVTSVDSEPLIAEVSKELKDDRLNAINATFNDFNYLLESYDLVNAQWSLPFNPPDTFNEMWNKVKDSIKNGGIFTGQFFGINDEWNKPGTKMTFHTKQQVEELLSGMEILEFTEEDKDSTTANGTPKHWHVYHVIARKKESSNTINCALHSGYAKIDRVCAFGIS